MYLQATCANKHLFKATPQTLRSLFHTGELWHWSAESLLTACRPCGLLVDIPFVLLTADSNTVRYAIHCNLQSDVIKICPESPMNARGFSLSTFPGFSSAWSFKHKFLRDVESCHWNYQTYFFKRGKTCQDRVSKLGVRIHIFVHPDLKMLIRGCPCCLDCGCDKRESAESIQAILCSRRAKGARGVRDRSAGQAFPTVAQNVSLVTWDTSFVLSATIKTFSPVCPDQ